MKLALQSVEYVNRPGVCAGKLHRLGDDRGEHGFEIERRVHRLRHFSKRALFLDRAAKLPGPLAQLVQQTSILDGDDCLSGEVLHQRNLLIIERAYFLPKKDERTDYFA